MEHPKGGVRSGDRSPLGLPRPRIHGEMKNYVKSREIAWIHLKIREITWNHVKSREITWNHLKSREITWNHVKSREITWNHVKSLTRTHHEWTLQRTRTKTCYGHLLMHLRYHIVPILEFLLQLFDHFFQTLSGLHVFIFFCPRKVKSFCNFVKKAFYKDTNLTNIECM